MSLANGYAVAGLDLSRGNIPPVNPVSTTMIGASCATHMLSAGAKSSPLNVYLVNDFSRIEGNCIQSTTVQKSKISPINELYEITLS